MQLSIFLSVVTPMLQYSMSAYYLFIRVRCSNGEYDVLFQIDPQNADVVTQPIPFSSFFLCILWWIQHYSRIYTCIEEETMKMFCLTCLCDIHAPWTLHQVRWTMSRVLIAYSTWTTYGSRWMEYVVFQWDSKRYIMIINLLHVFLFFIAM